MSYTTYAITEITGRTCIRFTELAYVVVAVFETGRAQFVSKKKIHQHVVRQECRNGDKLRREWKIGEYAGEQQEAPQRPNLRVVEKRVSRAGFEGVTQEGDRVIGYLPADGFDAAVALQCAKENGWKIEGNKVIAA